jgi:hypothetical protein
MLVLRMVLFGVDLFVLFEILRPLERLVTNFTDMRFEWSMNYNNGRR